ncbi:MAG: hypothetical protein WCS01_14495, partial [bacterium]
MKIALNKELSRRSDLRGILLLALFTITAGIVFHALWQPGTVLFTSDDNLGLISAVRRMAQSSLLANWTSEVLWGMPGVSGLPFGQAGAGALP